MLAMNFASVLISMRFELHKFLHLFDMNILTIYGLLIAALWIIKCSPLCSLMFVCDPDSLTIL